MNTTNVKYYSYNYTKHIKNGNILKKFFKYFKVTETYCTAYFSYVSSLYTPFVYEEYINKALSDISNCSNIDSQCYCIQQLVNRLQTFNDDLSNSRDEWVRLSFYIFLQSKTFLSFIKKYNITDAEIYKNFSDRYNSIYADYCNYINMIFVSDKEFQDVCDFLSSQFNKYRAAKRGNPILRTLSEFAGGFLGGYVSASSGSDLLESLNLGATLGGCCEELFDTFTSSSRSDKINCYENTLDIIITQIHCIVAGFNEHLTDIKGDLDELNAEMSFNIIEWMKIQPLRRKDIIALFNELNCINITSNSVRKIFKSRKNVMQIIKEKRLLSFFDRRRLYKLINKGI